jgi:hypothetical protein
MEVMLNRFLGPVDIQIGSWPETIGAGGKMNRQAYIDALLNPASMRYMLNCAMAQIVTRKKLNYSEIINSSIKAKYATDLGRNPACSTAAQVKAFTNDKWNEYYKFCFVRNPFDFEVSDYYWRTKGLERKLEFKDFIQRKIQFMSTDPERVVPSPVTNWPIYTIDDQLVLDFVGKYENINCDIKFIAGKLGLPLDLQHTPKAKSNFRTKASGAELYDDESKEMVFKLHENEIKMFGYGWPFAS